MKKILIIVGGGTKHLAPFESAAEGLGVDLTTASFSDISYDSKCDELFVKGISLKDFDVVYVRLVGKRLEDLLLLLHFTQKYGIRVVEGRIPLRKSLEINTLSEAKIPVPRTFYGSLAAIKSQAPEIFGYPFVVKSTSGKQGHEVWSPQNGEELDNLITKLVSEEKEGKRYLAQEFIRASQRIRAFVIGERVIGAITRPTRWRGRFTKRIGQRKVVELSKQDSDLALSAAKALGIEVAGVDIIHDDVTGKSYILEVNSAPRWASIAKDTGVNVEREILKYFLT